MSAPITGKYWAEGPTPLLIGNDVYVYFDKYRDHKYGAVRSKDQNGKTFQTWLPSQRVPDTEQLSR